MSARDAGYPPLVTPSSQIVGTQAVFNVLMGRYKVMTGEFADLMLGYYGETLGAKNPEVIKKAVQHSKKDPITGRPADLLQSRVGPIARRCFGVEWMQRKRRRRVDLRYVPGRCA